MQGLGLLDWAVVAAYGVVVLAIGAWANRRQRSTEDYFLGGRRMRWWAIGISLIATSFSSTALIGGTGYGFKRGLGYLQLQIGDLLAIVVACAFFLPFYARLRLTTAYEYLEKRFGVGARTVASLLFLAQTLLRAGVLVLGPALALAAVSPLDLDGAILASGLAAVVYSAAGGIQAVVWTDLIQFGVVVLGVVAALFFAVGDVPGGVRAVLDHAEARHALQVVTTKGEWGSVFSLWGALLAYGTLALGIAGTNQQAVQRYLSCRDLASARRAAVLGWAIGFVAIALTLFLGVALAAWSASAPGGAALAGQGDRALPLFILTRLPVGLSGLLVAAIFAASMSSMDSAIHAMSTATIVDFVRRFRHRPLAERSELLLAKALTAVYGLVAIAAALLAAGQQGGLLETLIQWLGYVAGPLLGLFVLGIFSRRATQAGALAGVTVASIGVISVVVADPRYHVLTVMARLLGSPAGVRLHPLWLAPMALLVTVGVGLLVSTMTRRPGEGDVRGLTVWG